MTSTDDVQVSRAKTQLEESYQLLCSQVSLFNTSQMERRKAHFINVLEAADPENALSASYIERARENALQTFPLKSITDEMPPCFLTTGSPRKSSTLSTSASSTPGTSRKKHKPSQSTSAPTTPTADVPVTSPTRPTWSGTVSVASSKDTTKIIPMDDLKVNLVLSGVERTLDFSQRISTSEVVHNAGSHLGVTFATIKRLVGISVIRECLVDKMVTWAAKQLDVISCKSFGVSYSKLKTKTYWSAVVKRGTHFVVFLDDEIVGYIPCFNVNALDNLGVPSYYGATQRRTIKIKNLACMGYIKSLPREDKNEKGVMQFAVRHVINWLLEAEPRLTGAIVVVKIPHSDAESSKPEIIHYLHKSKNLAEGLNMQMQDSFTGSYMGKMNAYLLCREEVT
jgi:hypothetical protein